MPPVNQQSSRGGLITAVIILAMISVGSLITVGYINSKKQDVDQKLADTLAQIKEIYVASSDDVVKLQDARRNPDIIKDLGLRPESTCIDVAVAEIRELIKLIGGADASAPYDSVKKYGNALLNNTNVSLAAAPYKIEVPTDSLTHAISALSDAVQKGQRNSQEAAGAASKAMKDLDEARKGFEAALKTKDDQVAAARKEAEDAKANAQKELADKDAMVTKATEDAQKSTKDLSDQLQKQMTEVQRMTAVVAKNTKEVDRLKQQLASYKSNIVEAMVRQPRGKILRIPADNLVYIDLGIADRISVGMAFEVYDKATGIPGLGDGTSTEPGSYPSGKASIEIIRAGDHSSECRVLKVKAGQQLSEGDLIYNVVYHSHTSFNFMVFGEFDPNLTNTWNANNAEVVKSLIVRWGGKIVNKIGPDADFLVIGREPVIPNYTKEELEQAQYKTKFDEATKAKKAYDDLILQAKDLHIPIMNQNRFFYYTGYYDQAKR